MGLQTEVMTTCVANLMKHGIINNSRKQFHKGKSVASQVTGDRTLWEFVDHNPDCEFMEFEYINDMRNIIQNHNVVSINNTLEIDLTGQAASEAIGPAQYSGTGGQLEWVIGSQISPGGRSILVLNSTFTDKKGVKHSKIKPTLPEGSVITTPRAYTQYVATEYGIVNLKFKSTKERAEALISLAHPDFRDELRFEAKKYGWL